MGLLDKANTALNNWLAARVDSSKRSVNIAWTGAPGFTSHLRGLTTKSGALMDTQKALGLSVVYACVSKISGTIAHLDLGVYSKDGKVKTRLAEHPASKLISREPQPNVTGFEFWQIFVANILIYGRAYAVIKRLTNGDPYELCLVHPDYVKVKEVNGARVYVVDDMGEYLPGDILHVNNLYGKSPVELHRDLLGLAKSAQNFASEFFGSSGNMTGILSSTEPLGKEQIDIIKDSWNNSGDSLGTKLLPFGFKYERIGVAPESAQVSQQMNYLNGEICRVFGVPPALVGIEGQQTYSNVEQQQISFSKHCIVPLCAKLEQELNIKLLAPDEQDRLYMKFNLADMLRGDSASRASYYDTMIKAGVMTINEVREAENLNPVDNGGDVHLVQVNQIALDKIEDYSAKVSAQDGGL